MASSREAADWTPGQMVPGTVYRLVRTLGQGGMGEVYEVEHTMLGCRRALKVLARDVATREDLAERLRAEARGLARLRHPNIVEVFDLAFAGDGRIFLVMELLQGRNLRALLRERRRLDPVTAVRLIGQVLDALAEAHQALLIHRDIKPENIFVCPNDRIKLLDFGVAKAIDAWTAHAQLTGAGMTVGTPRYMAPEQTTGRAVDARTDVYAAGLVLWEALAGRPAFDDADLVELARNKLERGVPPISASAPGLPPALASAVMQACARQPGQRFPGAQAFALALRAAVGEALEPWPLTHSPTPEPAAVGPEATIADARAVEPTVAEGARVREETTAPDPAHEVHTERIEVPAPIDRDAPTPFDEQPAQMGPTGTRMLPAIAARSSPAKESSGSSEPSGLQDRARPRVAAIAAVAFFVPVLIACAAGALYALTRAPEPEFPAASAPAPSASAPAASATTETGAPESATPPAASGSASAATVSGRPPAVGKPKPAPGKQPGSALPASGL